MKNCFWKWSVCLVLLEGHIDRYLVYAFLAVKQSFENCIKSSISTGWDHEPAMSMVWTLSGSTSIRSWSNKKNCGQTNQIMTSLTWESDQLFLSLVWFLKDCLSFEWIKKWYFLTFPGTLFSVIWEINNSLVLTLIHFNLVILNRLCF